MCPARSGGRHLAERPLCYCRRSEKRSSGKCRVRSVNIDRHLALLFSVLLAAATGCDARIEERQETDAELSCREEGFDVGSTAYADCVEARSGSN